MASSLLSVDLEMIYGLYQSAGGMMTQMENHQAIAENLAASSVPGFRRNIASFETYLPAGSSQATTAPAGSRDTYYDIQPWRPSVPTMKLHTDFSYGALQRDGSTGHLAISGRGFFALESPEGQTAYSRNGSFTLNGNGELVTQEGWKLMGENGTPMTIPKPAESFSVSEKGELAQNGAILGKVKLVDFENQEKDLTWIGGRYFTASEGIAFRDPSPETTILQGYLEGSNVNAVHEMVSMIQAARLYEANQKMLQAQDESLEQIIRQVTNR